MKSDKSNVSSWLWSGTDYARNSKSQQERALVALGKVEINAEDQILDLGCGDGKITARMAQVAVFGKVIGLDKDPSMLAKAQEYEPLKNLSFIQADASNFRLNEQFDLISSFFCLQWLPASALLGAFKNIYEHLKERGKICILLPLYDFPHEVIKGIAFSEKWKEHFKTYTEPQIFLDEGSCAKLLSDASFQNAKIEQISSSHPQTAQEFIDFTRQWCGCYTCLKDESLREEFINDIKKNLATEGEPFNMTQKSLSIIAEKPKLELTAQQVKPNRSACL